MSYAVHPVVLKNLSTIAEALATFDLESFVFVGGAAVGLLVTDTSAAEARETRDVDVVTPDLNKTAFNRLEADLRAAGFSPDPEVICRWQVGGVTVDIMPPDTAILGFSNPWYRSLLEHATRLELPSGKSIKVASAPYMLATKLEAFANRGDGDYLVSHDIEDVVILLDGRPEIVREVLGADESVRSYIKASLENLVAKPLFLEAIEGHLAYPTTAQERAEFIQEQIKRMVEG